MAGAARAAPTRHSSTSRVVLSDGFVAAETEQLTQIVGAHLGDPRFAGADDAFGQSYLALNEIIQRLFERAGAHVLVYLNVFCLADAKGAICCLIFDGRIPPAVVVKNVVGPGQVETGATGLERQNEDGRSIGVVLELRNQAVALGH